MIHTEYRDAIESLDLSQVGAVRLFGVDPRTSRRWALGDPDLRIYLHPHTHERHEQENAMADWQPIETAPKDGTRIRIRTEAGREFNVFASGDFLDEDGNYTWGWVVDDEDDAPECWTDGVCWAVNEYGEPSDQPVAWMPPPAASD